MEETTKNIEHSLDYHIQELTTVKEKVKEIEVVLPDIKEKVNELELMKSRKMVEIQGIPENTEENTLDIVTAIANKRGIPLTHDNIDYCYRSKSKKAIVVCFMQTHARNKFYSGSRIPGSKLMAKDIGYSKSNNQIFVNE